MTNPARKRTVLHHLGAVTLAGVLLTACGDDDDLSHDAQHASEAGKAGSTSAAGKGSSTTPAAGKSGSTTPAAGKGSAGKSAAAGKGAAGESGSAGSGDEASDAGEPEPTPDASVPATNGTYALAVEVYNPDNSSTTYVATFNSLDVSSVDLKQAHEFAGRSDLAAYDGKLYVTTDQGPTLSRFTIGDDGKLKEDGSISFAKYGVESTARSEIYFISKDKAYLSTPTGYAIWNPSTLTLTKELKVTEFADEKDGLSLNTSLGVVRGDRLYKTYLWLDWTSYVFSKESYVAVFDLKEDKLISMTAETRCPGLNAVPQLDEAGNIYLSNWFYNVADTLMNKAPHSCVVRIPKDQTAPDADWILEFDKIAGGHEGAQLSYIAKDRAVFSVFHEEDFKITADTMPWDLTGSLNWETWSVDLKDPSSAKAVPGIDRGVATQVNQTVDGRTFVFIPGADWATVKAFELSADGQGHAAFQFDGSTFQGFVKVK